MSKEVVLQIQGLTVSEASNVSICVGGDTVYIHGAPEDFAKKLLERPGARYRSYGSWCSVSLNVKHLVLFPDNLLREEKNELASSEREDSG